MSLVTRPRIRGLLNSPAALLLAGAASSAIGCADPPPLQTATGMGGDGSSVITNVGPTPRAEIGPARQVKTGVVDHGVRGGPPAAGGPYDGLSALEKELFVEALDVFKEADTVSDGAIPDAEEEGSGLGPTF